ncbi:3-oxoacyl-ACP reductase FabG [Robertmurraya sp. DFI.2.37]|uniref:3-oxoacyl-ACP reductase FabG n=1 Tax=Robertmurraya sp. DFI.2.37 TaxID=3031819 RepID=UPI00124591A2|nr:3-oxoacyl-ACP reductase FabG [Robertmurraya sp. DFI.2.37]MDF1506769.1 3-oxoacyl-ACP reductase FabG [Robertmurraya sp. DFI.2.37]
MKLKDKVAVITGGANGIGKETANLFLREGAKVVITDVNKEAGAKAVTELSAISDDVLFFQANVSERDQVANMVNAAVTRFGKVDILINNAGITIDGLLAKMDDSSWDKVLEVNLTGVYKCSKAVLPIMLEQGSGVILNASSVVGLYGNVGQTNYAATKAGVIGLTKSWAKELGPKGIRVNAVAPGFIITDMTAKVPEKILKMMEDKTPLKKLGKPEDIANAYLFLASDQANYVNGTILSVDGGLVV